MTDKLGQKLEAAGIRLPFNGGALQVTAGFELPAPWNLPSRLFRFPIETQIGKGKRRRIGLMHPLLGDHPFVKHVEAALGTKLPLYGAPNDCGYSQAPATWWHAVDLIDGNVEGLMSTRQFTTDRDIKQAVLFGLGYCHKKVPRLSRATARELLAELGCRPPLDQLGTLKLLMKPSPCKQDSGAIHWPLNEAGWGVERPDDGDAAWGRIWGLDQGWFAYNRGGFIEWTEKGRDIYETGKAKPVYVESKTGQLAMAL